MTYQSITFSQKSFIKNIVMLFLFVAYIIYYSFCISSISKYIHEARVWKSCNFTYFVFKIVKMVLFVRVELAALKGRWTLMECHQPTPYINTDTDMSYSAVSDSLTELWEDNLIVCAVWHYCKPSWRLNTFSIDTDNDMKI